MIYFDIIYIKTTDTQSIENGKSHMKTLLNKATKIISIAPTQFGEYTCIHIIYEIVNNEKETQDSKSNTVPELTHLEQIEKTWGPLNA